MVCLLTPTVAARWMADRPRFRRSVPRLVSISGISICCHSSRCARRKTGTATNSRLWNWLAVPGLPHGKRCIASCLSCVTLILLQDMRAPQVLFALAALSPCCLGQAGKAELFGAIQDPQDRATAQAKVTTEEQATGARFDILTDDRGEYHLLGLAAGQYVLAVEKPGFRPYRRKGITLRIGDQTRLNVKLELGPASQVVDVNAQASLLETASGTVSYHVSQPQLETLPLDGRNFIPLVALSPGVALPGGGSLLPRINGSRPRTNEYLYDGISVLEPEPGQVAFYPIVDAM